MNMPIRLLLEHDHSFGPEEIHSLISAFEDALQSLELTNREDLATLMVARVIFEAAKDGGAIRSGYTTSRERNFPSRSLSPADPSSSALPRPWRGPVKAAKDRSWNG
jgi:hypothetical protein